MECKKKRKNITGGSSREPNVWELFFSGLPVFLRKSACALVIDTYIIKIVCASSMRLSLSLSHYDSLSLSLCLCVWVSFGANRVRVLSHADFGQSLFFFLHLIPLRCSVIRKLLLLLPPKKHVHTFSSHISSSVAAKHSKQLIIAGFIFFFAAFFHSFFSSSSSLVHFVFVVDAAAAAAAAVFIVVCRYWENTYVTAQLHFHF